MKKTNDKMNTIRKWIFLGISIIGLTIMECLMFDLCGVAVKIQEKIELKKRGIL